MTDPNVIRGKLDPNDNLPTHKMKYDRQVIWCLDPTDAITSKTANNLQGKRMAAGDDVKSQLVWGLQATWPTPFPRGSNVRLYIVAHGIEVVIRGPSHVTYDTHIQVRPEGTPNKCISVDEFHPLLKRFIEGSPSKNVRRISLAMCISAGIRGRIPATQSFAKKLADMSADLTDDVTGRAGNVNMMQSGMAKADADELFGGQPNPLYTFKIDTTNVSLINAWKHVDGRKDFATYIFEPGSPPELKSGYTE